VGLGATVTYLPTVGSVLNPMNVVNTIKAKRHPPLRDILTGFQGVVHPGEMLRQSFLYIQSRMCFFFSSLTDSGPGEPWLRLHDSIEGPNQPTLGIPLHTRLHLLRLPHHPRHLLPLQRRHPILPRRRHPLPTLTVEETIEFAASTRAPHTRLDKRSRRDYVWITTSIYTMIFGLRHVLRTRWGPGD
jgi:ATP-binding cassette, subfamily G (WHITE), member 2, SNQ2